LPDDDVFREELLVVQFDPLREKALGLSDESGSLLVNEGSDVLLDSAVRVGHLRNDEVQEDQRGEDYHYEPQSPE